MKDGEITFAGLRADMAEMKKNNKAQNQPPILGWVVN